MFMAAWAFKARHCTTLLNEIKKTKLQIYTEPQAGTYTLCAPNRRVSQDIEFQGVKSLTGMLDGYGLVVSRKVVCRKACSERLRCESRTSSVYTDEAVYSIGGSCRLVCLN